SCSAQNSLGQPSQFRYGDAVALGCCAFSHTVQENNITGMFTSADTAIRRRRALSGKLRQLMIVCRKQRPTLNDFIQMFRHRPSNGEPIKGAGAPANLVQYDE